MIIGLSGFARSGKDTVADILVENHGFVKMSFADPMRDALLRLNPLIQLRNGPSLPLAQALRVYTWDELKSVSTDIRGLLQRMGSEVGREMFGENLWVDYAIAHLPENTDVVFSDVRYKNEAKAILALKGRVWRIEREGIGAANEHASENDLNNFPFELTIDNNFPVEQLALTIDTALDLNILDILRSL